ncbi:thiamine diphosphokinase [Fusibacter sp. JL216-2]|uniref:thiamine diphosphokinase n=1 Tax=Fusibacter sp. JL216-2 TaxID=3071453 RepID=UPI003D35076D
MSHLLVVINGDIHDYDFYKDKLKDIDQVIAVDGGSRHVDKLGLKADVLLGDFDSISSYDGFLSRHPQAQVIQFPSRKNFTDSELAVEFAIEQKPDKVTLIGCIGTRMDHTFATVLLLKKFLDAGVDACMVDESNEIRLIDSDYEIQGKIGELMSIVPVGGSAKGIYLHGFEYPLTDATLDLGSSTGISNVFASEKALIKLREGLLLVFKSRD